jgi:hypothetical protein
VWKNSKLSEFCMAAKVAQGMVPAIVAVGGGLSGGRVKGGLQQRLHSFVKKVLLQQLVPAGAVVGVVVVVVVLSLSLDAHNTYCRH